VNSTVPPRAIPDPPSLDLRQTGETDIRSKKIAGAGTNVRRKGFYPGFWGTPGMATATYPAGFRFGGWIAVAGLVFCLGLIAKNWGGSIFPAASGAQSPVVRSADPLVPRLSPPWEKLSRPAYPVGKEGGERSPFSYATPYKDIARGSVENVAPAWAILYEPRPARRHKR
jgi:hypothetical protein